MEACREVSFVSVVLVVVVSVVEFSTAADIDDAEMVGGGLDLEDMSWWVLFACLFFLSFFGFSWLSLTFLLCLLSTSVTFSSVFARFSLASFWSDGGDLSRRFFFFCFFLFDWEPPTL